MNTIGTTLAWTALQVTILALTALVIYELAGRRQPGTGKLVTMLCLSGSTVLTLLSFCPVPKCWAWRPFQETHGQAVRLPVFPAVTTEARSKWMDSHADSPLDEESGQVAGLAVPAEFFKKLWRQLEVATVPSTHAQLRWPCLVAGIFLAGVTAGLLRLTIGCWAAHACRRRSQSLEDAGVIKLIEELRLAMGCPR